MKLESKYLAELAGTGLITLCAYSSIAFAFSGYGSVIDALIGGGAVFFVVYCLFQKSSGGHFNPGVTAAYWLSGKMEKDDAMDMMKAQLAGGVAGLVLAYIIQLGATDFDNTDLIAPLSGGLEVEDGYLGLILTGGIATALLSMVYFAIDSNQNNWVGLFKAVIITAAVGTFGAVNIATETTPEFLASLTEDFGAAILALVIYVAGVGLGAYAAAKIWNKIYG